MKLSNELKAKLEKLDTNTKIRMFYRLRLKDLNNTLSEILVALVEGKKQVALNPNLLDTDEIINDLTNDGSINYYRRYILHNLYDNAACDSVRYKNLVGKLTRTHRAYDFFDSYTLSAYTVYYTKLINLFRSCSATKNEICYLSDEAKNYTLNVYGTQTKHGKKFHQFDFGITDVLKIPKEINKDNRGNALLFLSECIKTELGLQRTKTSSKEDTNENNI